MLLPFIRKLLVLAVLVSVASTINFMRFTQSLITNDESSSFGGILDTATTRRIIREISGKPKVAVIVAGSFERFILSSTIEHLFEPLSNEFSLDYYAMLIYNATIPPYRKGLPYTDRMTWDPIFGTDALPTVEKIQEVTKRMIEKAGGQLRLLRVNEGLLDISLHPELQARHRRAALEHPDEDIDLRFPMLDIRPKAVQRNINGNRNMLRLFFAIEQLWNALIHVEKSLHLKYDYVLFLRDDVMWLKDFDLSRLVDDTTGGDAYVLSCDDRKPPMLRSEINDHGMLIRRDKAEVMGRYFSELFRANLTACAESVRQELGPTRGCNSEMILKWILHERSIELRKVPQSWMPFQRAAQVLLDDGTVKLCYHKFCQSVDEPLQIGPEIAHCKDLKF